MEGSPSSCDGDDSSSSIKILEICPQSEPLKGGLNVTTESRHRKFVQICPPLHTLLVKESELVCPVITCQKKLTKRQTLSQHLKDHFYGKEDSLFPGMIFSDVCVSYHCPIPTCPYSTEARVKSFPTLKRLKQHFLKTHAPKVYSCPRCKKCFSSEMYLGYHERRDCGNRFVCSSCPASYSSYVCLQTHTRRKNHVLDVNRYKANESQRSEKEIAPYQVQSSKFGNVKHGQKTGEAQNPVRVELEVVNHDRIVQHSSLDKQSSDKTTAGVQVLERPEVIVTQPQPNNQVGGIPVGSVIPAVDVQQHHLQNSVFHQPYNGIVPIQPLVNGSIPLNFNHIPIVNVNSQSFFLIPVNGVLSQFNGAQLRPVPKCLVDFGTQTTPQPRRSSKQSQTDRASQHNISTSTNIPGSKNPCERVVKRKKSAETQTGRGGRAKVRVSAETQTNVVMKRRRVQSARQTTETQTLSETRVSPLKAPQCQITSTLNDLSNSHSAASTSTEQNPSVLCTITIPSEQEPEFGSGSQDLQLPEGQSELFSELVGTHSETQTDPYLYVCRSLSPPESPPGDLNDIGNSSLVTTETQTSQMHEENVLELPFWNQKDTFTLPDEFILDPPTASLNETSNTDGVDPDQEVLSPEVAAYFETTDTETQTQPNDFDYLMTFTINQSIN